MKGIDLLADYVFLSKYSQKKPDGTLENWDETIDRIYAMHEVKLQKEGLLDESVRIMLNEAKGMEKRKEILSSQRGRQFASPKFTSGILKHETKMYNCCSTYIDRLEAFSEIMYLLLCGCGVGYSLHKEYVNKLPVVQSYNGKQRKQFFVEDSIEGWADSIKELVTACFNGESCDIVFDNIRPEGSLIDGKFIAPGPEPLIKAHQKIREVFQSAEGRKLKTIEVHDILCYIADSVVSGGVRRSAMIALFDKDDELMLQAKTGNWWAENPQRAMANNSILTTLSEGFTFKELKQNMYIVKQFGEPGFVSVRDYRYVVNPCGEIVMLPSIDGETGFAFCNLVEINAQNIKTKEDFYHACRIASFVATVQSLYTDFKYLSETSRRIAERDRAIGVSITGLYSNPILRDSILSEGAGIVRTTNKEWANYFDISSSRACTTIKPSGNASSILGLYCSGIHPAHAYKYIRRVRIKTYSPEYKALKGTPLIKNLKAEEAIISFPIEAPENVVIKDDVRAVDHLKYIGMVKHYWINKGCEKGEVANNVSATVEVKDKEWYEVAAVLFVNDYLLTGVSLLPKLGDQIYDNAPFQRLSTPELKQEYNAMLDYLNNHKIDLLNIMSNRDDIHSGDMAAIGCAGGACELK